MDADFNNQTFIIIWDDGAGVNVWSGDIYSGVPTLIGSSLTTVYHNAKAIMPDVSIYDGSTIATHNVFYTYVRGGQVFVDEANFSSLSTVTNRFSSAALTSPINPRIGSPPYAPSNVSYFTVVYNDGNKIKGASQGYGSQTYTNVCSTDISGGTNINNYPVVSYSNDYNSYTNSGGILVAWSYYYYSSSPSIPPGTHPIAVQCDYTGTPVSGCYYMYVPYYTNSSNSDVQDAISHAGRDDNSATDIFYSWYSGPGTAMEYKSDYYTNNNLRTLYSAQDIPSFNPGIYPNPTNDKLTMNIESQIGDNVSIEIYNSVGQRIYATNEVSKFVFYTKEISMKNFDPGIYLVRETGILTNNIWKVVLLK
jgi:hypothetical protein